MPPIDVDRFFDESEQYKALKKKCTDWESEWETRARKEKIPADDLVKVHHNGRIVWLTANEVQDILEEQHDEDKRNASLKNNVEKSLYGSSRALAEEMRVLLYLAIQTLSQRVKEGTVSDKEAEWFTNSLRRRFEEVESNIEGLIEAEEELTARKKAEPVFATYEKKMAEMLRLKKEGRLNEAASLAKQLERDKKHYLLLSRALEPLTYVAFHHRLDLQKDKSRVLVVQRRLCEMRDALLRQALQEMRESLGTDDDTSFEHLAAASDSGQGENVRKYLKELKQLALELKVLVNTIEEVDHVCKWIEHEIFKDETVKKATIQHRQTRKAARDAEKAEREPDKHVGMAVMDRLKKKGD
ncbi:MAG: hypothetical protein ABIH23_07365 [bacterium]